MAPNDLQERLTPTRGLIGTRGHEVGLKSEWLPGLQTTLALWQLDLDAEQVYVGDAGTTEAGRRSRRTGVEWTQHWRPNEHWSLDASLAWTRPRFNDGEPQSHIPNAVQQVANLTLALHQLGPWSAALGLRHVGSAPLNEANTVRSRPSLTSNLRVSRALSRQVGVSVDVLNLLDRRNDDVAYAYESQLRGELQPVLDRHIHPAMPRTVRVTARVGF